MKQLIKNMIITILLILFITNLDIVIDSTKESCILFVNKIFISIFPFIILSNILLHYDYHIFLKQLFGNFLSKLFNIDPNSSIIFILSILTGSPSNTVYIKDMLDNNQIDIDTANKILCFTFFSSIPFVIGVIGLGIFKSFKIGLTLWLLLIVYNLLIGIYLRNTKSKININYIKSKKDTLIITIKKGIINAINTSFIILGILTLFMIIINLIKKYFIINPISLSILSGLLEITSGINELSNIQISNNIKIPIMFFILSFGSLSLLFQSFSILNNYKINIKRILIIKLVFSLIMTLIIYLLFNIFSI